MPVIKNRKREMKIESNHKGYIIHLPCNKNDSEIILSLEKLIKLQTCIEYYSSRVFEPRIFPYKMKQKQRSMRRRLNEANKRFSFLMKRIERLRNGD